jgi:hypothetical protein
MGDAGKRAASIIVENVDGIFRHKEPWAQIRNNSETLTPHPSVIRFALSLSCLADGLARHAGTDQVNTPLVCCTRRKRPHVTPTINVRPMLGQYATGVVVALNLPLANHASPFKTKVKATNSGE